MRSPERFTAPSESHETPSVPRQTAISSYARNFKASMRASVTGLALMMPASTSANDNLKHDPVLHDQVDIIELNETYSTDDGKFLYHQMILRDFTPEYPTNDIRDFMQYIPEKRIFPRRLESGGYILIFHDKAGRLREIIAAHIQHTKTLGDPETAGSELPRIMRKGVVNGPLETRRHQLENKEIKLNVFAEVGKALSK
jgi:hypothetical protein